MQLILKLTIGISYILSVILLYFIKPKFILKENKKNKEIDILKLNVYSVFFTVLSFLSVCVCLFFYEKKFFPLKSEAKKQVIESEKEKVFNFISF